VDPLSQAGLVLVMEHIKHLANIAAMVRSCDAFGVAEVAVIHQVADVTLGVGLGDKAGGLAGKQGLVPSRAAG
jgi:tRNA G18 (ribose-2'-O)-methylase SpoU